MPEVILLKTDTVEITPKVARFGNTAYQVANIGSVSVHNARSMNSFAILMGLLAPGLIVWGAALRNTDPDRSFYLIAAGVLSIIVSTVVQKNWPVITYTVVLKTFSGDTQALSSTDRGHVRAVQDALEEAFVLRT